MEKQRSANILKTRLLFSALFLIFLILGGVIGYIANSYFIGGISAFAGIAYTFHIYSASLKQIIKLNQAQKASRNSHGRLYRTVENFSISLGIPAPEIYVIEDPSINAFAAGKDINKSIIGVTTGLLENLNRQELEGVIAHELSHIVNQDVRVKTFAYALVFGIFFMIDIMVRSSLISGGRRSSNRGGGGAGLLIALGVGLLFGLIAVFAHFAISREREYLADVSGAQITRYPAGLASALEKIERHGSKLQKTSNSTAYFFLANPVKTNFFTNFFKTHPPIELRIERLREAEDAGY